MKKLFIVVVLGLIFGNLDAPASAKEQGESGFVGIGKLKELGVGRRTLIIRSENSADHCGIYEVADPKNGKFEVEGIISIGHKITLNLESFEGNKISLYCQFKSGSENNEPLPYIEYVK